MSSPESSVVLLNSIAVCVDNEVKAFQGSSWQGFVPLSRQLCLMTGYATATTEQVSSISLQHVGLVCHVNSRCYCFQENIKAKQAATAPKYAST